VPWFVYLAVTVAEPAAGGAWHNTHFAEYALVTLIVSGAIVAGGFFMLRAIAGVVRCHAHPHATTKE